MQPAAGPCLNKTEIMGKSVWLIIQFLDKIEAYFRVVVIELSNAMPSRLPEVWTESMSLCLSQ